MSLYEKMNRYLANQQVMYIKLHNLHWYVEGSSFFTLHAKFEELYNHTAEVVDDVAERILTLGNKPVASLKEALAIATLKELPSQPILGKASVETLLADVDFFIKESKELVKEAEKADDVATADLFTGYLAEYQKLQWMLKTYLK